MRRLLVLLLLAALPAWAAITALGVSEDSRNGGVNCLISLTALGLVAGDVVVVTGGFPQRAGEGEHLGPLAAFGYTKIASDTIDGVSHGVWYRVVVSNVDSVRCGGTANLEDVISYVAIGLRGVDTSHVVDTLATMATGSSTNPDPPAITTVTDGAWVIACGASIVAESDPGTITNYTNDIYTAASDTRPHSSALCTRQIAAAGSENPGAWNSWATGVWRVYTVAIRPAAGAAPPASTGNMFLVFP